MNEGRHTWNIECLSLPSNIKHVTCTEFLLPPNTDSPKQTIIPLASDLPEVRDGVRQGTLGGDVGRHPGVVLSLQVKVYRSG